MNGPKLRVKASGLGGSGYRNPITKEIVPGVTTVTGAIDKSGALVQWAVNNTASYAVANLDALHNRDETQGYGFLRWYHKRMKESDFDDPTVDIRDYSSGVLNDAAELGTAVHEYVEADLNGWFEPDLIREEQYEMVAEYLAWREEHEITVHATEITVFGEGYAGTADIFWRLTCKHADPCVPPGTPMLVDTKTSRSTWDEHLAQLSALSAAHTWMREVGEGEGTLYERTYTPYSGAEKVTERSWWVEDVLPPVASHAILHIRPSDYDHYGVPIPAFCKLKVVPQAKIDVAYDLFRGALAVRLAQQEMKTVSKSEN